MKLSTRSLVRTVFLLWVWLWSAASVQAQEASLAELDAYIEDAIQTWQIPGAAVAIVKDGEVIFDEGYGVRELDKQAAVDEHTLFAVASNTKAFTAALLGTLVQEGKLGWDDRVIDYLPHLQLYDPYVTRDIRIRDLLTHRSGLPTFGGDHLWIGNDLGRDEIIERLRYLEPTAPFRAKYQYQNLMFAVAGEVAAVVTGKSWAEALQERILTPLGMTESTTRYEDLMQRDNVATPHEVVEGELMPIAYDRALGIEPAGGLNSNVMDMTRWMWLNLNGGTFDGQQILSEEVVREMQQIQFSLPVSRFMEREFGTRFSGYGLGWFVTDYRGRKMVSHGGGLSGMISLQTLIPEEKLGVIILTNFAPHSLTRALTYRILDEFLGAPERDWAAEYRERREEARQNREKAEERLRASRVEGTEPSLPLEAYAGTYFDELSGEAEVRLDGNQLLFDYNPRHLGPLEHWNYDTFRVHWQHPIHDMPEETFLTFELGENGQVSGLTVTFYDPLYFKRVREE